jgi:hypothetical protein
VRCRPSGAQEPVMRGPSPVTDRAPVPLDVHAPAAGAPTPDLTHRFWSEERSLSSLLAVLIVYHVAFPAASELGAGRWVGAICLSLIAVSSVLTSFRRRYLRVAARTTAVAVLLVQWLELATSWRATVLVNTVADAVLVSFLTAAVATQVFKRGPVSPHRIRGAIVVYLLIGALFGFVYQFLVLVDPDAIRLASETSMRDLQAIRRELSYFSFVTLTTLGYGDIAPVSPVARSLVTLEAMTGQLYIAITIARLVSIQSGASDAPEGSPPAD